MNMNVRIMDEHVCGWMENRAGGWGDASKQGTKEWNPPHPANKPHAWPSHAHGACFVLGAIA